jgi:hypothetical protein
VVDAGSQASTRAHIHADTQHVVLTTMPRDVVGGFPEAFERRFMRDPVCELPRKGALGRPVNKIAAAIWSR